MSKWTKDPLELKRISDISRRIIKMAIVEITFDSGEVIEGALCNVQAGNNASSRSSGGAWLYYGNFDIELLDGQMVNIDMCSVKSMRNLWQEKSVVYEAAGIIQIVR